MSEPRTAATGSSDFIRNQLESDMIDSL